MTPPQMSFPIPSRRPDIWVPTEDGIMLRVDKDAPQFVRLADFNDIVEDYEIGLRISRAAEADARQSALETSQREARWMMIENRLQQIVKTHIFVDVKPDCPACGCATCALANEIRDVLNSDPPIGTGFQSEQTSKTIVSYNKWNDPKTPGSEVIHGFAQASIAAKNEADIQGGHYKAFPDASTEL